MRFGEAEAVLACSLLTHGRAAARRPWVAVNARPPTTTNISISPVSAVSSGPFAQQLLWWLRIPPVLVLSEVPSCEQFRPTIRVLCVFASKHAAGNLLQTAPTRRARVAAVPTHPALRASRSRRDMLLELLDQQRRCTLLGWSKTELLAQVHAFDLLPWGVSPRARVGLLLQPGIGSAVGLIAALTWHCAVPLSPTGTAEGTAAQLKTCGCTCLVASGGMAIAVEAAVLAGVPLVTLHPRSAPAPEGAFEIQPPAQRSGSAPRTAALAMRGDDAALILLTSGTTGQSKRVVYPLRRLIDAGRAIADSLALTANDVALNFLPLHHVGGIACNLMATFTSGSRLRCEPRFDARAFFSAVTDTSAPITWCYAVPAMWRKVLEFADANSIQLDAPSLRIARSAAADLSHADALRLARLFGPTVAVLPTYAMTECMPVCSPPLSYRLERAGSVGLPIAPVRIIDQRGATLPPGQVGEISIVRTGQEGLLFDGYEEEARRLTPTLVTTLDGELVFQTGDRGYLDAEGWLYHVGRSKEMVNRGRANPNPNPDPNPDPNPNPNPNPNPDPNPNPNPNPDPNPNQARSAPTSPTRSIATRSPSSPRSAQG